MRVNEIFHSIQGESSFAGWPCVFVRLTGCNLRCAYCDTRYAYTEGEELEIEDVLERAQSHGCRLVEVTGGEPLLQSGTPLLVRGLLEAGLTVLMETNGSFDIDLVDRRCIRIVDFKGPSSGESHSNDYDNLERLSPRDEVKLLVADEKDYAFALDIVNRMRRVSAGSRVIHFSPIHGIMDPAVLAGWIIRDRIDARLNLQIHKIVWGPDRRGV